jgi:DNA-3-methyladenine glycosylase II
MPSDYINHLSKDKVLKKLLKSQKVFRLKKRKDVHLHLCGSIMSQQLSTKVADIIHARFLGLYENRVPKPDEILATPFEALRAIGLSNAKTQYILNVARFAMEKGLDHRHLSKLSEEEIIVYLTGIKGVGRWTSEMLLMFTLGREDVFPADDLGIQKAMISLYGLDSKNKKKLRERMQKISANWSPYRTYACLHLWRWKDKT